MTPQRPTEYRPTRKEEALLNALLDPQNRLKSISDVCGVAGCDRSVYYDAFAKPEFVALYKEMSLDLVKQSIMPVIHALTKEARRGSYQHQKMLLEMADMYTEKVRQEHTGADGGPIEISTADLVAKARALAAKVDKDASSG